MSTVDEPGRHADERAIAAARPVECPVRNRWVRRIGAAGFLFFLVKGLLWLTVPAGLAAWRWLAN